VTQAATTLAATRPSSLLPSSPTSPLQGDVADFFYVANGGGGCFLACVYVRPANCPWALAAVGVVETADLEVVVAEVDCGGAVTMRHGDPAATRLPFSGAVVTGLSPVLGD
jgi:hypothetical protein